MKTKKIDYSAPGPIVPYYGGKWRAAPQIVRHFPKHKVYCEVFGGGGSILLRKRRSKHEVYNDINSDIVNLFRILRDEEKAAELKRLLDLTPFAREEMEKSTERNTGCEIENARRLLVGFYLTIRAWTGDKVFNQTFPSVLDRTGTGITPKNFRSRISRIPVITRRLRKVVIENKDFRELIKMQDSIDTFFYVDPPYISKAKTYFRYSSKYPPFTAKDHCELLKILSSIKGKFILSGSDDMIGANTFPPERIRYFETVNMARGKSKEAIFANFPINKLKS